MNVPRAVERLPEPLARPARALFRSVRSRLGARKRAAIAPVGADRLRDDLRAGGVREGDIVMVHASLKAIGNVEGGAEAVVDALMGAVGPGGGVMMGAYGDGGAVIEGYRRGELVDLRSEPSQLGAITEAFRRRPDVRRSSHPFSSVCAWGARADWLAGGHADDPGITHRSSPIGRLLEAGGSVLGIGVSLGPVSFYHVLEDTWDAFPLAVYLPPVEVGYVDAEGERVTRPVRRFDPDVRRTRIDQPGSAWLRDRLAEHVDRTGLRRRFAVGDAVSWTIGAQRFYDELRRLAEKGVTIYLTEAEWAARGEPVESW